MSEPFLGEIRMFAGNFAPLNWALCDGSLLNVSQHTALYSILGNTYGGTSGSTFALPDLRGRAPVHPGVGTGLANTYTLGVAAGSEKVTLTTANLPAHTHALNASSGGGTQASPSGGVPAVESTGTSQNYASSTPDVTMSSQAVGTTGSSSPTAISVIQPVLPVNFIIAISGTFPTRS